jgi:hypothetical protein
MKLKKRKHLTIFKKQKGLFKSHKKLFEKPKKYSYPFIGFIQATGLVIYIGLIDFFITTIGNKFNSSVANFYAPILMLLLFTISAVISASLVLGKAGILFWNKKYKESFTLLGWTVGWSVFYFMFFVMVVFVK